MSLITSRRRRQTFDWLWMTSIFANLQDLHTGLRCGTVLQTHTSHGKCKRRISSCKTRIFRASLSRGGLVNLKRCRTNCLSPCLPLALLTRLEQIRKARLRRCAGGLTRPEQIRPQFASMRTLRMNADQRPPCLRSGARRATYRR